MKFLHYWIVNPLVRTRRISVPAGIDQDLAGLAGAAPQALASGHEHLGGAEIVFLRAGDLVAHGLHHAAELMPWNQRETDVAPRRLFQL